VARCLVAAQRLDLVLSHGHAICNVKTLCLTPFHIDVSIRRAETTFWLPRMHLDSRAQNRAARGILQFVVIVEPRITCHVTPRPTAKNELKFQTLRSEGSTNNPGWP
jgi:hypothetical protein